MIAIRVVVTATLFVAVWSFCELNVPLLRTRSKPLSTAGFSSSPGTGSTNVIPRLEPGLRYVQSRINFLSKPAGKVRVSLFNLNKLSSFEPERTRKISHLFGDASVSLGNLQTAFLKYMRKLSAAVILFASSGLLPMRPLPSVAHPAAVHATASHKAGVSVASILAAGIANSAIIEPAQAGVLNFNLDMLKFKQYRQLTPTQRLATTPLYFVANSRGNSYLQSDVQAGRPDQKIVTYFMSSDDASDFLNEMTQVNGGGSSTEFRLMTVSMEKVVNQIQARKQSRKLGRYEMDTIYRIQPSSRQVENAQKLTTKQYGTNLIKATQALKGVNIPMFSAQGLTINRANGEVITPYYFAYEDLLQDWSKLRATADSTAVQTTSATKAATTAGTAGPSTDAGAGKVGTSASGKSGVTGVAGLRDVMKAGLHRVTKSTTTSIPAEPTVAVHEFADVMVFAQGITTDSLASLSSAQVQSATTFAGTGSAVTNSVKSALPKFLKSDVLTGKVIKGAQSSTSSEASKASAVSKGTQADKVPATQGQGAGQKKSPTEQVETVGFMPPRREIEMIRRYYRNEAGFKNEFSKSKMLG